MRRRFRWQPHVPGYACYNTPSGVKMASSSTVVSQMTLQGNNVQGNNVLSPILVVPLPCRSLFEWQCALVALFSKHYSNLEVSNAASILFKRKPPIYHPRPLCVLLTVTDEWSKHGCWDSGGRRLEGLTCPGKKHSSQMCLLQAGFVLIYSGLGEPGSPAANPQFFYIRSGPKFYREICLMDCSPQPLLGLAFLVSDAAHFDFFLFLRRSTCACLQKWLFCRATSTLWSTNFMVKNVTARTVTARCSKDVGGSSIACRRMNRLDFSVLAFGLTCLGLFPPACHDAQPEPWTTMILQYGQWLLCPKRSWNRCLMCDVGHLRLGSSLPLQSLARAGAALSVGDPPFWSPFATFRVHWCSWFSANFA